MEPANVFPETNTPIDLLVNRIVNAPFNSAAPFVFSGTRIGEVYAMAGGILSAVTNRVPSRAPFDQTLCVCSLDRAVVAASLIAALSGRFQILLPFSNTMLTLYQAQHNIPFRLALLDSLQPLPSGVEPLLVQDVKKVDYAKRPNESRDINSPWLYLFTGGTTGTPQIWSKSPLNLLSEVSFLSRTFQITSDDTILATVPVNHIYGLLYSLLLPLITGATVSCNTPSFPKEIDHMLSQTEATVFISIPAHYRALRECPITHLHHLRLAFSSAGALAEDDDLAFFNSSKVSVTEIYGSTETGGIAYRRRSLGQSKLTPFACVDIDIKDEHLWVKSDFLSAELLKNESGFFQTSDRAMLDGTTGFRLLGRSDGIVKIGGNRVDLAEIQTMIKKEPGVRDAYVFSLPEPSGRENEIVALAEGALEADALRESLRKRLEPHALPRRIRIIDKIPLSASGKYDRAAIEILFQTPSL